jgi:carboxypeptidase Q
MGPQGRVNSARCPASLRTMTLSRRLRGLSVLFGLTLGPVALTAGQRADDVATRIRAEGLAHSEVMALAAHLTDVTGPRLTGSASFRAAQAYAVAELTGWGAVRARVEPWGPFGRGWQLDHLEVSLTAPGYAPLLAYAKAWSPGTGGPLTGEPVLLNVTQPDELAAYRGTLRGRIVLFGPARSIPAATPPARLSDEDLAQLAIRPTGPTGFQPTPAQRATAELYHRKWQLLYEEQPALVIEASSGPSGSVYVTASEMPTDAAGQPIGQPWDAHPPRVLPQMVMAAEPYNRLARLAAAHVPFAVRADLGVSFEDRDLMSGNVLADLPGTDQAREVVMFGGCLDSWHTATGATDNAAGAAVVLEAMRLLRAVGARPRRTIRLALWSAEEQGALGSKAYVVAHLGHRVMGADGQVTVSRGAEYDDLDGYFNVDWGPGRLRGLYLQGNDAAAPLLRSWLAPVADLGASTVAPRPIGGTDHVSFDDIGLPGFQFIREIGESSGIAHTNMDVFDRLNEDDLKQAATVLAILAYEAAMADDKLPHVRLGASSARTDQLRRSSSAGSIR